MKASDRVSYQNKPLDRLTKERLVSANLMVRSKEFGSEKSDITLVQGIGGATASGGTHIAPGGATDTTPHNHKNRVLVYRLLGGTGYYRPALPGVWAPHIHDNTLGVGYAPASSRRQHTAYWNGRNGLANNGKDTGPRLSTRPLFVAPWTERGKRGVYYATKNTTMRSEGSSRTKAQGVLPKGGKFTVVAVVSVSGKLWAINADGKHALKSDLTMNKVTPIKKTADKTIWEVNVKELYGKETPDWDSKTVDTVKRGDKITGAYVAFEDDLIWVQNISGNWYAQRHLKIQGSVPNNDIYEVVPKDLFAKASPGWDSMTIDTVHKGDKITGKNSDKGPEGLDWIQNIEGRWFAKRHLKVRNPSPLPPTPSQPKRLHLRPASYNFPGSDKLPDAAKRSKAGVELLKSGNPDFIGLQEMIGTGRDGNKTPSPFAKSVIDNFGSGYQLVVPTTAWNENYAVLRTASVSLSKQYPDTKLYADLGGPGRHISRMVLADKDSGEEFGFGVTHLVTDQDVAGAGLKGLEVRQQQGQLAFAAMDSMRKQHGDPDMPLVIVGDFNMTELVKAFISGGLQNVAVGAAKSTNKQFQSYAKASDDTPNLGKQIDHIYASKEFTMLGFTVLLGLDSNGTWPLLRPSDHVPIIGAMEQEMK